MGNRQFRLLAGVVMLALGCGEPPAAPVPGAASVQIVSAVDTILALGRTAQLTATAKDAAGNVLSAASFTWTTNNAAVVTVSAAGLAQPQGSGVATVTATTTGASPASGTIRLIVVPADLTVVATLAGDPFATALLAAVSAAARTAAQTAWARCGTGASAGKVVDIVACVDAVRAAAAGAADPTDKVLLAVLQLYVEQVRLRLGF